MNSKYRVWCKNNNEWEKDRIFIAPDGKIFEMLSTGRLVQVSEDTHIIQWNAGIPDCKNNEAYEGDILKAPYFEWDKKPQSQSYGIIKRENETCNLYIEWHFKRTYNGETYWDKKDLPLWKVKEHEIVGNIYQNKDLLKEEG